MTISDPLVFLNNLCWWYFPLYRWSINTFWQLPYLQSPPLIVHELMIFRLNTNRWESVQLIWNLHPLQKATQGNPTHRSPLFWTDPNLKARTTGFYKEFADTRTISEEPEPSLELGSTQSWSCLRSLFVPHPPLFINPCMTYANNYTFFLIKNSNFCL